MRPVLTPDAMRAFERVHIDRGVSSLLLMENAGRGAAHLIGLKLRPRRADAEVSPPTATLGSCVRCADERSLGEAAVVVVCGPGNNGGDGYVVARHLLVRGASVVVVAVGPRASGPDVDAARRAFSAVGGRISHFGEKGFGERELGELLERAEVVVDALLGIGLTRPVEGDFARVVELFGASDAPVYALDVPSGLDADRGVALGAAVRATHTITFGHLKTGLFTTHGAVHSGRITLSHIGVPSALPEGVLPSAWLLDEGDVARELSPRQVDSHKVRAGRVLTVAGSPGMLGAARLSARGAERAGAGLVTVASSSDLVDALGAEVLEVMTRALADDPRRLDGSFEGADALVVGPGLGRSEWAARVVHAALARALPTVLDADGLRALGQLDSLAPVHPALVHPALVLTPHAGEAAALLGTSAELVEADRFAALAALVARSGAVVVLKGPRTLIGAPGRVPMVSAFGTPALATAGAGDVLAGVIGALLAAPGGHDSFRAAWVGVALHGLAAEQWSRDHGDQGLLAQELADAVPSVRRRLLERAR